MSAWTPFVYALLVNVPILVLDIKDCYFSRPLHEQDYKHFTFSILKINKSGPADRYEWKILPEDMANSFIICQEAVVLYLLH